MIGVRKNVFSARVAEDIDSRIASYFFRAVAAEDDFLLRLERTDPRFAGPRGCRGRSRDPERKARGCGNLGPGMFIGGDALRLMGPA